MTITALHRALSAFNSSTRRWAHATSLPPRFSLPPESDVGLPKPLSTQRQRLSLISWNVDAFTSQPAARASRILNHILLAPPDIVFLQEVTRDTRAALLNDARVRTTFSVCGADDDADFEGVPFSAMTLLSRARFSLPGADSEPSSVLKIRDVTRVVLPSEHGCTAICVDVYRPTPTTLGPVIRLINVHLDSMENSQRLPYREKQRRILSIAMRQPGLGGGIIAGDYNAMDREDSKMVNRNALVDAWAMLYGSAEEVALYGCKEKGGDGSYQAGGGICCVGLGEGGLDDVFMMSVGPRVKSIFSAEGVDAPLMETMEVLRPGNIEVPRPGEESLQKPWSDHCGLKCTFVV
ncbi:Endonuclease/exonuclease/phosphatase [Schizophyllum amplum]|uniref:Endonuclease/exonuclease/phosphatase n=1 Tax=Schizophyllum amplum TaxID=97359 RepID=A0A550BZ65_9AGAR|nr:Endonuclease/exonuclease/phosphatase [Auriculariopsis ampla]